MNANGVVKVFFGGAHFDGDGVALGHFAGVGAQIMKTDNAVVI